MKKYLILIFSCFALNATAQQAYEMGVVIDSISVANTTNETFTLYLPTGFKSDQPSPILFVFSPSGRGKNGVEVFKETAETYNYMLVCSNDARNGSYDRNFGIAERLFDHIFSNFNIAEKRIYLAGFSGGSRLVTAIASLTGKIEGVVACGAGFSQIPFLQPAAQSFSYAGLCGESDMNFQEMIGVKEYLDQLRFSNTLFTYEGNHRWPSSEYLIRALDWLEMESVKKGNLQKSKDQIYKRYKKNYALVRSIDPKTRPLLAYAEYERLLGSYKRYFTLDTIVNNMRAIQKSTSHAKALKLRSKVFEQERDLAKIFVERFHDDYEKPEKVNMKWWIKKFQKLDQLKEENPDGQMQKMLSRFRYKLYAMVYETQQLSFSEVLPAQKAFCKDLYVMIYPKMGQGKR